MKTKAVRLYGKSDLRFEEFELPEIQENEILAKLICDTLCTSSYKEAKLGPENMRVPKDCDVNPIIIGHEFCGEFVQVGAKYQDRFKPGQHFYIQPAIFYPGREHESIGYSFKYCGGNASYVILPWELMERGCVFPYDDHDFYKICLAEPLSCIAGAFHATYHTKPGEYVHTMGAVPGGNLALLGCGGPMGLGAIDYALHNPVVPAMVVVTDIDRTRLDRAKAFFTPEMARARGIRLEYVNPLDCADSVSSLLALTNGRGYDDVFVFAPVKDAVETANAILAKDGCMSMFAGATDTAFNVGFNMYRVHYHATHLTGTSGGTIGDMQEVAAMIQDGTLHPSVMITHVGGLDSALETTMNMPHVYGAKKLIYNQISMPMTPIADFRRLGAEHGLFAALADICDAHDGLWSGEAEAYLLAHGKPIA